MIEIDFTKGKIISTQFEGKFTFFEVSKEEQPQVEKILTTYAETNTEGCEFGFIRDHTSGDIYAVAIDGLITDNGIFMKQFRDWVMLEAEDLEIFELDIEEMVEGFLPDHWTSIKKCFEMRASSKHKGSKEKKWAWRNMVLEYSPEEGGFYTLTRVEKLIVFPRPMQICVFTPNEVFPAP